MLFIIEQEPVKPLFVVPLDKLTELRTHKGELFAGVSHQVAEERPHGGKLFFIRAGHFVYQRAFAVNNLVMGYGQNEILRKSVEKRERKIFMIKLSEISVQRKIFKAVVHPAHVPFKVKAESAVANRL